MRSFHNAVKKELLDQYLQTTKAIIDDYCSGRLGDVHKWRKFRVKHVNCVDISEESRTTGLKRWKKAKDEDGRYPDVQYEVADLTDEKWTVPDTWTPKADIGCCMFGIHYLCRSKQTLVHILRQAASRLPKGAHFVGVCLDGDKVASQNGPLCNISVSTESKEDQPAQVYVKMHDTIVEDGSLEYVVTRPFLEAAMKEAGFALVEFKSFRRWAKELGYASQLDDEQASVSYLHMSFAFQKM